MNAKIYKDGTRIIVSFEGFPDAEEFLRRVTEMVSGNVPVEPVEIPGLDAPATVEENLEEIYDTLAESDAEKEPEIEDFDTPFTGKLPVQIMAEPKFEGVYFLCETVRNNKVPAIYIEEVNALLEKFIETKGVLNPPYGNPKRMQGYIKMAQRILGKDELPDNSLFLDDEEWLEHACDAVLDLLKGFYAKLKS